MGGPLSIAVSLAFLVASCAPGQAPSRATSPIAVDELRRSFGCDETLAAADDAGTAVIGIRLPGILERSRRRELPYREELAIDGETVVVRLEQGAELEHWCTDVMSRPPRIDTIWNGVSGTATVTLLREELGEGGAHRRFVPVAAVVELRSVRFVRRGDASDSFVLPTLEIAATLGVPGGG